MSKFKTSIAIPQIQLPEGSRPLETTLSADKKSVELIWENDNFVSGYTFPVDFTKEQIEAREVPDIIRFKGTPVATPPTEPVTDKAPDNIVKVLVDNVPEKVVKKKK